MRATLQAPAFDGLGPVDLDRADRRGRLDDVDSDENDQAPAEQEVDWEARAVAPNRGADLLRVLWCEYDEALEAVRDAERRRHAVYAYRHCHPAFIAWEQAGAVARQLAARYRRAEIILAGLTAAHVELETRRLAMLDRQPAYRWPTDVEDLAYSVLRVPVRERRYDLDTYEAALRIAERGRA